MANGMRLDAEYEATMKVLHAEAQARYEAAKKARLAPRVVGKLFLVSGVALPFFDLVAYEVARAYHFSTGSLVLAVHRAYEPKHIIIDHRPLVLAKAA